VLRQDGFHNTSPHITGRFITELPISEDALYTWRYTQGMKHNLIDVSLEGAFPGDTAVYELLDVPSTVAVVTAGWTQAVDESDLFAGAGRRWFYRQGSLFLKMLAAGPDWHAKDLVRLCMTGPGCSAGLLNLGSLPSVTITAPADGARFPAGAPIQVDATLSDPNGIRASYLYLGTQPVGADRIAPYSWTLTGLAPGAYSLKLIAEDTTGRTFTAVQQLFVGEPTPRVEITSLVENGTYLGSSPLNVAFNVFNWTVSPTGTHLRLIVDDVDAGPLFSTAPTAISNLSQGEHEIEVALALADGTATAMTDRVKVYIQNQKVIADFEDGIDSRGSLAPEVPGLVGVTKIGSAWGTADPVASRADLEDDINWWDIQPIVTSPNGFATYRLRLEPARSWVGSTHLEITTDGIPFEAFVEDAQQGLTSLGVRTGYVTTLALPANTTLIDQVVAIRLRYNEAQMTSSPARQHLRRIRLLP
jgi:Bacterial Ig domain